MSTLPTPPERTSTYPLDKLLSLWRRGDLTSDQMIGHLLQHVIEQDKRRRLLEQPPASGQPRPAAVVRK